MPTSGATVGAPATQKVIRLVVAPWPKARIVRGAADLERGPRATGVFARFADGRARRCELLDDSGSVARTVRPGDGTALVAALRPRPDELVWLVTGLDDGRPRGGGAGADGAAAARRLRRGRDRRQGGEAAPGGPVKFVPTYRPRPSALHSARAGVAAFFCCSLAFAGAIYQHPLVLAAALTGIGLAAAGAGVGREVLNAARVALPFALLVTLINPLVYQEGDTLLFRGGELLGRRFDITLEATVAGALAGVRVVVIIVALWLMSVAVDPDALLRLFRRISYRSALTASLATRLVPVLARDASRMSEAARCRPQPVGRLAVARSALAGALDRSVDLAAALELRGYALAGRPARRPRALVPPRPPARRRRRGHRAAWPWRGASRAWPRWRPIRG